MRQMVVSLSAFVMACSGGEPMGPTERGPQVPPAVVSVRIEPEITFLSVGSRLQLKVFVRDAAGRELSNRPVVFISSNERIVRVDSTGLALGLEEGTATITATSEGKSGRTTIAVFLGDLGGDPCGGCWDYNRTRP